MTILVTGARGRVGRAVLHGLLAAGVPADDLRGTGRDPDLLALPAGVRALRLDPADPATVAAALDGVDRVFLYAAEGIDVVADAARDAGVEHVVVLSSLSVQDDDGPLGAHHREAEDAVRARGLTTTALRPGAFATNALDWAGELVRDGRVSTPYPDSEVTPIHEDDIADAAVALLTGAAASFVGGSIALSGPESLSFRAQVGVLAHELDRDVAVVGLSPEQARERMGRRAAPGRRLPARDVGGRRRRPAAGASRHAGHRATGPHVRAVGPGAPRGLRGMSAP